MKVKKETKSRYAYALKIDQKLRQPLKNIAAINRRTINEEINIAIERHLQSVK